MLDIEPCQLPSRLKGQAAAVLNRAFRDDPLDSYLLPDPVRREQAFLPMWKAVVSHALAYGQVFTTAAVEGVACWLPPGRTDLGIWQMLRTGLALPRSLLGLGREARRRSLALVPETDKLHHDAIRAPHWYLWVLGVEPARHGQGIGGALLRSILDRADAEHTPCYLETVTPDNVAFYAKRGFQVVGEVQVVAGLTIWAMVRVPQTG